MTYSVELWKKQIAENDGITSLQLTLHKLILLYCVQWLVNGTVTLTLSYPDGEHQFVY